jgi:energy-coupling factor transporter transmembrane protein EcfT
VRLALRALLVLALGAGAVLAPLELLPILLVATLLLYPFAGEARALRGLAFLAPLATLVVLFNGLVLPEVYALVGRSLSWDPWRVGAAAALRLATLLAGAAWLRATTDARELRPLLRRVPRVGLVALAAHRFVPEVRRDLREVRDAQRARGHDPGSGLAAARAAAPTFVPMVVRSLRRGVTAGRSLRARGYGAATGLPWGRILALVGLGAAARLAFAWAPNVTPTYLVVVVGGIALGPLAGALVGGLTMVVTDLLLSGPHPVLVADALSMGALGLVGGLLRGLDLGQSGDHALWAVAVAAALGAGSVLVYSLANDAASFLLLYGLSEGIWDPAAFAGLASLGLAFNAVPAAANALLFAAALPPTLHALARAGLLASPTPRQS